MKRERVFSNPIEVNDNSLQILNDKNYVARFLCSKTKNTTYLINNKFQYKNEENDLTNKKKCKKTFKLIKKRKYWSHEEDEQLKILVKKYGNLDWEKISKFFKDKNNIQCSSRYNLLKKGIKNNPWSITEENQLKGYVEKYGERWNLIYKLMKKASPRKLKEKYYSFIKEKFLINDFSNEEDFQLFILQKKYGNKWGLISNFFQSRRKDELQKRYYLFIKNNPEKFEQYQKKETNKVLSIPTYNDNFKEKILFNIQEKEIMDNTQNATGEVFYSMKNSSENSKVLIDQNNLLGNITNNEDNNHSYGINQNSFDYPKPKNCEYLHNKINLSSKSIDSEQDLNNFWSTKFLGQENVFLKHNIFQYNYLNYFITDYNQFKINEVKNNKFFVDKNYFANLEKNNFFNLTTNEKIPRFNKYPFINSNFDSNISRDAVEIISSFFLVNLLKESNIFV